MARLALTFLSMLPDLIAVSLFTACIAVWGGIAAHAF